MSKNKSGSKTLLMSVLMSAPGPLVVGIGLIFGRSSTQLADFVRRSAELLGIIMAYVVYLITSKDAERNVNKKEKLERFSNIFVGAMMFIGGTIMLVLSFTSDSNEKGSVIGGLVIALLGVVANTLFWIKYTKLNLAEPNAILRVQARLYRAKSLVDICVTTALLSVMLLPGSAVSAVLDTVGSAVVAVYLMWCGAKTVLERLRGQKV